MCEWPSLEEGKHLYPSLPSRPKEKEPENPKDSRKWTEQLRSENSGLEQVIPTPGSDQTDATSKIGVVAGPSSNEFELPYRSLAAQHPNTTERGGSRTRKKKVRLDSNPLKRRHKRADIADPTANNFFPERSDRPDHVPSSNIPKAGASNLSRATQKSHRLPAPHHVHPETATACEVLEAGIAPFGSSFSSADCETPSSSYPDSFASDTADIMDYETDSTDIDPRQESIPGQTVADLKQIIVDRIMKDFCSTFYTSEGIRVRTGHRGGDNNVNRDSSSRNVSNHAPATQTRNIQALIRGGGGQGDRFGDDEGNDGNQDQHANFNLPAELPDTQKLACPYYKRDPSNRAHHRSCRGPGWITVARVK